MGPRQPVEGKTATAPAEHLAPEPGQTNARELLAALADGASALRRLSRDFAYDHNRFVKRGDRDQAAAIATKHYERLHRHADLLDALIDALAHDAARQRIAASLSIADQGHPDEDHA